MNKIIKGKCVSLSSEGKGIIKIDKDVIFVDSLLLGEEAEVEITYSRSGISYGKIKKLLSLPHLLHILGKVLKMLSLILLKI